MRFHKMIAALLLALLVGACAGEAPPRPVTFSSLLLPEPPGTLVTKGCDVTFTGGSSSPRYFGEASYQSDQSSEVLRDFYDGLGVAITDRPGPEGARAPGYLLDGAEIWLIPKKDGTLINVHFDGPQRRLCSEPKG